MTTRRVLIGRGAEALIFLEDWLGLKVVYKVRVPKRYRLPEVDLELRRHRTLAEARCMLYARSIIRNVPRLLDVNLAECSIRMEYIEGVSLRDLTAQVLAQEGSVDKVLDLYTRFGEYVGLLHSHGLIHGDLALTNVLVRNSVPYLIDFGLSYKHSVGLSSEIVDEKTLSLCARDLNVFLRNVEANFASVKDKLIEAFLEGYIQVVGQALTKRILAEIRRIRSLARYAPR